MSRRNVTDPELYCASLEWYLTGRDADCGVRSNFGAVVAAIEGFRGGMSSGDRFTSAQVDLLDQQTAFARDRIMRPRWAALDPYSRDILSARYTAVTKIGSFGDCKRCKCETHGFQRFPKGFSSYLGDDLAGVALYLAQLDGTLASLLIACDSGKSAKYGPFAFSAEQAIREAHLAYYQVANSLEDPISTGMDGGFFEAMSDFSEKQLIQTDGVWHQ